MKCSLPRSTIISILAYLFFISSYAPAPQLISRHISLLVQNNFSTLFSAFQGGHLNSLSTFLVFVCLVFLVWAFESHNFTCSKCKIKLKKTKKYKTLKFVPKRKLRQNITVFTTNFKESDSEQRREGQKAEWDHLRML